MKLSWATLARGDDHGYAVVAKELCQAVEKAGAEFTKPWAFGADVTVVFALPSVYFFQNGQPRRDIVWHTMVEAQPVPAEWVAILNLCGAVWAPSRWVAEQFKEHGVTVPIFVSGYGISPRIHHPPVEQRPLNAPLRVGCWGDTFGSRKNVSQAIEAFLLADLPADATLEVKVNAPRLLTPQHLRVAGEIDSRVVIHNGSWTAQDLTDWLRSLDVMVYVSGGEGYGLMPLETMACGVPVISMIHTGMADYMTSVNTIEVPVAEMVPSTSYYHLFDYEAEHRRARTEDVADKLRWAYFHRRELQAVGRRAAADVAGMTWERAGVDALAALEKVYRGWDADSYISWVSAKVGREVSLGEAALYSALSHRSGDVFLSDEELAALVDGRDTRLPDADALGGNGRTSQAARTYHEASHGQ